MKKILLVDDDELFRDLASDMLETIGHSVTAVTSAEEALEILKSSTSYNLILTDISMPIIDGIELIKRIRVFNQTIPIYAISGGGRMNGQDLKSLSIKSGADKYITKPFDLVEFNSYLQ